MAETHSLRAEIDASGARRGAADFESAIRKIGNAVRSLDRTADSALSRISSKVGSVSFAKIASDLGKLGGALSFLDRGSVNSVARLSRVINGFRGVSPAALASVRDFSRAVAGLQQQSAGHLAQELSRITAAAAAARSALQGLRIPSVRMSGGSAGRGMTGSGLVSPSTAYGFRGLEASLSLSRQAGTVVQGAIGGVTAGNLLSQIYEATDSSQKFAAALRAVGTSANMVEEQQRRVTEAVRTYGLNLYTAREQFASFNAAVVSSGITAGRATAMFEDAAVAMGRFGMGPQQQEGALRAISQMFGKGRIMSEELFQQMAEHWSAFPGILARTLNMTMPELRQRMQREVLDPRVIEATLRNARALSENAAATVSGRMRVASEQVRTAWREMVAELGEGPAGQAMVGMFERMRDILRDPAFRDFAQRFGVGLADVLRAAVDTALWASQNLDKVTLALKVMVGLAAVNFLGGLAGALANLARPAIALAGWLGRIAGIGAGSGGATAAGGFLGSLSGILAGAAGAAAALGSALLRVGAFLTGPWGAAVTAVGGIGTALYASRDAMVTVGGETTRLGSLARTVFGDMATAAGSFASDLIAKLTPAFEWLKRQMQEWWRPYQESLDGLANFAGRAATGALRALDSRTVTSAAVNERREAMRQRDAALRGISGHGLSPEDYQAARAAIEQRYRDAIARIDQGVSEGLARAVANSPGMTFLGITQDQISRSRSITINPGPMNWAERAAAEQELAERGQRLPNSRPLERPEGNPWSARPGSGGRNAQQQFEAFRAQLDPGFRVQNDLATGMRDLATAQRQGWITGQQRLDLEQRLRDSILETVQALDPRTKAENQLREATQLLAAMQERGLITEDQRAQRLEVIRRRLEDNIDPMGAMLRQIEEETNLTRLSTREMEIEGEVRQRVQRLREQGVNLSEAEADQLRTALRLQRQMTQAQQDREAGLATWANGFRSISVEVAKLEEKIANDLTSGLADFVTTGKANFSDLATSIVNDVNRVIIQQGLREFLRYLGIINGSVKEGFSNGSGGGLVGTIAGWLGISGGGDVAAGAGTADAVGNAVGSFLGAGAFAEGGYATNPVTRGLMPATAWVGAPHYAEGTANTRGGIPAVLHPNEAVIPLSRGRRVPVEMKGGGASPMNIYFDVRANDADSFRRSKGQITNDVGKAIARSVRRNG